MYELANIRPMRINRGILTGLAVLAFAASFLFLIKAKAILSFFNSLSASLNLPLAPVDPGSLARAVTVGYLYLLMVLAWRAARRPDETLTLFFISHGSFGNGIVAVLLIVFHAPFLVYIVHCIISFSLGFLMVWLSHRAKRWRR
jgi:hypothetical protein